MTMIRSDEAGSILVREASAERLGSEQVGMILYADHDQTGGALSANRALIADGTDGAAPHFHTRRRKSSSSSTAACRCWPATTS